MSIEELSAHSLLGASSAKRFLECGASYYLEKTLKPENKGSEFAEIGTRAHAIAEVCLNKGISTLEFKNLETSKDVNLYNLDVYVSYIKRLRRILNGKLLTEQKLKMNPLVRGTVDAIVYNKDEIHIIDYKNGAGVIVDVEANEQLMYYAFLAIYLIPDLAEMRGAKVVLTIVQPNVDSSNPIKFWVTDTTTILNWAKDVLLPRINYLAVMGEPKNTDYKHGEHCRFCNVILDCPLIRWAFEQFSAFSGEDYFKMRSEDLDYLYSFLPNVKTFCTRMEEAIEGRIFTGETFTNAKLVKRRTFREWKEGAEEALIAAYGENVIDRKLKSPATIEKEFAGGKQFTTNFAFTPITDQVTIASRSDKRAEITPRKSADVFANLPKP